MVKRHSYPTRYPGCEISVATERMKDGKWSVVATIEHQLGEHELRLVVQLVRDRS